MSDEVKKIDYDDILANMNLFVEDGKLRIVKGNISETSEPKRLDFQFKPMLSEKEKEEIKKKEEQEVNKRILERKEQHKKLIGLQKARTSKMSFVNNYPEQVVQDIPQRTTAIFPINYWR